MDDGYWAALLRDVEEETEPASAGTEAEELAAGLAAPSASYGVRRWNGLPATDNEEDWQHAEELLASGEPVEVKISGYNRGGLLADFGSLQGFVPASHLLTPVPGQTIEQRAAALAARIGATLTVRVAEIDRDRCRLILSERLNAGERPGGHPDSQPATGAGMPRPDYQPLPVRRVCGPGWVRGIGAYFRIVLGAGRLPVRGGAAR